MREWLENLQPRERRILLAGAVVAAVIAVWGFIWSPLSTANADLRLAVAEKQRLEVALLRTAALPARDAVPTAGGAASASMLVLVERTQQAHGLAGAFTQTRPDGPDGINVTFQNASFDAMLDWLVMLQAEHGVSIEIATFSSTRQAGLVSGRLFLRRV